MTREASDDCDPRDVVPDFASKLTVYGEALDRGRTDTAVLSTLAAARIDHKTLAKVALWMMQGERDRLYQVEIDLPTDIDRNFQCVGQLWDHVSHRIAEDRQEMLRQVSNEFRWAFADEAERKHMCRTLGL